jgi:hypothetical protein
MSRRPFYKLSWPSIDPLPEDISADMPRTQSGLARSIGRLKRNQETGIWRKER